MLSICCVTDDKPGHKSQLDGLLQAMSERTETKVEWLHISDPESQPQLPTPPYDLIIAAGHKTHIPALKLKWKQGGKVIVLMKPSIPRRLFDLCLIPEHDEVKPGSRVFVTKGALNPIRPSPSSSPSRGLILIGGPSKHFRWSDQHIVNQLIQLKRFLPQIHWTLTTSRRTPSSFLTAVEAVTDSHLTVTPVEQTDRPWLLDQFQHSGMIWVSKDSISMIYESLSSGALVGVMDVPMSRNGRLNRSINTLIKEKRLLTLVDLVPPSEFIRSGHKPLREADRAAEFILQWLPQKLTTAAAKDCDS